MNWLRNWWQGRQRRRELILLPCDSVLFPGGQLDMTLTDLRWRELLNGPGQEIGLCLQGRSSLYPVGTLGKIVALHGAGSRLRLTLAGGERFRLLTTPGPDAASPTDFEILPRQHHVLPERFRILLPLLQKIVADQGKTSIAEQFDDAEWVGFRFCEILPIPTLARYKLLELDNPIDRLEILQRYLDERKLLQG